MRDITFEFSVLEPIASNKDSVDKITPEVFSTVTSILNPKLWMVGGMIGKFADDGLLGKTGRYTLWIRIGFKMRVKLIREL